MCLRMWHLTLQCLCSESTIYFFSDYILLVKNTTILYELEDVSIWMKKKGVN